MNFTLARDAAVVDDDDPWVAIRTNFRFAVSDLHAERIGAISLLDGSAIPAFSG
jgi:hypothetical protein